MSEKKSELFQTTFKGYNKTQVNEFVSKCVEEKRIAEEGYTRQIELLRKELATAKQERESLYQVHLSASRALAESAISEENLTKQVRQLEALVQKLKDDLKEKEQYVAPSELEAWKERADTTENALKKIAESELEKEQKKAEERVKSFTLPVGKRMKLDVQLRKRQAETE